MKVRDLMSSPVHTCRPQDSLARAAQLLWQHDCGVLPVVDRDGKVGAAITDRDICMGAWSRGQGLDALRVADSMSKTVVTCRAEDDLGVAAEVMGKHQVHRLPVVDEQGKAIGLLSLNDMAVAAERDPQVGKQVLRVLGAVCHHREDPAHKNDRALAPIAAPAPAAAAKPLAATART